MEMVLAIVTGLAAAGVVVQGVTSYLMTQKILAKQDEREELHRKERERMDERLTDQQNLHYRERRELYERIQAAPVNVVPLLTEVGESGTDKGSAGTKDPDELSPEELAKIGVVSNSDGGFIDLRSKDKQLCDTVKDLLFFREEAEKEKKAIAASV